MWGAVGGFSIPCRKGTRRKDNSLRNYFWSQLCSALRVGVGRAERLALCQGTWLPLPQGQALLFCLVAAPDHFSLLPFIFPSDLLVPNDF